MHDGVGNTLAAAVLHLEVAAREQERSQSSLPTPALLREEAQTLRQAMNAVRDWTYWTRPWTVSTELNGLTKGAARLTEEIARFSRRTGLSIHLHGEELLDNPRLTKSDAAALRLTIFRIAQEALTNVAKHAAGATSATVSLRVEASCAVLRVSDDGPGFADVPPKAASD